LRADGDEYDEEEVNGEEEAALNGDEDQSWEDSAD
jgi:hypothetical protein